MIRPHIDVDLRPYFLTEAGGHHAKELIVLHETVSHDRPGVSDITGPAAFLDSTGLEIHGIIDIEAHSGWCYDRRAIYDHARSGTGMVNTRSVGFEQVSDVPFLPTRAQRRAAWDPKGPRRKQLNKVAEWCAWLSTVEKIPLKFSDGRTPGITSHWNVSETFLGGDGHWDCWPIHMGGHYPILYVINRAKQILEGGV
jgi:hypothetical protein